jgi:hypothetical protein
MRKLLLAASFAAIAAIPAVSQAQSTACQREARSDRAAGTIVGGVAGALLGSAIAGNSSNTEGTIIGGVAGAIAGNQIAKSGNRCPQGYYEVPTTAPVYRDDYNSYYDARGGFNRDRFWAGAPTNVYDRIAFLEQRVRRGIDNGAITRREADRAFADISRLRRDADRMRRDRYGRYNPRDEAMIQRRLDDVSQQIRWAAVNSNRRYR